MNTPAAAQDVSGGDERTLYNFAVLSVVPRVHVGASVPVGVIVFVPTEQFVGMRVLRDVAALGARIPGIDAELLARYLASCQSICDGDESAGPVALGAPSERFHWLTAPRSDVIQSGPVHEGVCARPDDVLDELFAAYVR